MIICEIGQMGIFVNVIGLGCMGLLEFYGFVIEKSEVIGFLYKVIDLGVNYFDIVEMYGMGVNEVLLGEVFVVKCDKVVIVIKFGFLCDKLIGEFVGIDGLEVNVCCVVEELFSLFKMDYIDLYYMYCMDQSCLIEEMVGVMVKLVEEGKICVIGLFEVFVEMFKCVSVVYFIVVLQLEYFIFFCDIEVV